MMAFIGVRISWLMLARNSLLLRLAASASFLGDDDLGAALGHQLFQVITVALQFLRGAPSSR